MKHIKNILSFAIIISAMILAIAYLIEAGVQGIESGKVVSGIIFGLLSIYSFFLRIQKGECLKGIINYY